MKRFRTGITLLSFSVALLFSGSDVALAKSDSSSSRSSSSRSSSSAKSTGSSSFKGGFSSQRSVSKNTQSSSSDNQSSGKKTSFGSFGKRSDTSASNNGVQNSQTSGRSAFSKDIDQKNAQSNAMKAYDAREAKAAAEKRAEQDKYNQRHNGGDLNQFGNSSKSAPVRYGSGQPSYPQQQPVIVHNNGASSNSNGWMWFMLGQAMSHRAPAPAPQPSSNNNQSGSQKFESVDSDGNTYNGVIKPDGTAVSAAASDTNSDVNGSTSTALSSKAMATQETIEQPSTGMHVFRFIFWSAVFGGIGWGIYRYVQRKKNPKTANYTLGKI